MTIKLKLIIALVSTLIVAGLIGYILVLKSNYKQLNAEHQATCKLLSDAEAQNEVLSNTIAQYVEAIKVKDAVLTEYTSKINTLNAKLKELSNDAKIFLSTRTPDDVKQLLISTDYYSQVSNRSTSSSVSGEER